MPPAAGAIHGCGIFYLRSLWAQRAGPLSLSQWDRPVWGWGQLFGLPEGGGLLLHGCPRGPAYYTRSPVGKLRHSLLLPLRLLARSPPPVSLWRSPPSAPSSQSVNTFTTAFVWKNLACVLKTTACSPPIHFSPLLHSQTRSSLLPGGTESFCSLEFSLLASSPAARAWPAHLRLQPRPGHPVPLEPP